MDTISNSEPRGKLVSTMDQACDGQAPVIITRNNVCLVVMLSLKDCPAPEATSYLHKHPKKGLRLLESIAHLERGKDIRESLQSAADISAGAWEDLPLLATVG